MPTTEKAKEGSKLRQCNIVVVNHIKLTVGINYFTLLSVPSALINITGLVKA